jgi:hypothetical protein
MFFTNPNLLPSLIISKKMGKCVIEREREKELLNITHKLIQLLLSAAVVNQYQLVV